MNFNQNLSDFNQAFAGPQSSQHWNNLTSSLVSDWGYSPNTDWSSFRRQNPSGQWEYLNVGDNSWGTVSNALSADPRLSNYMRSIFPTAFPTAGSSNRTTAFPAAGSSARFSTAFPTANSINGTTTAAGGGFSFPDFANVQGPYSTSQSRNQGSTSSYSGIGPQNQPTVDAWVQQLDSLLNRNTYGNIVQGAYGGAMNDVRNEYAEAMRYLPYLWENAMSEGLQGGLNQLARTNMLNSTVGSELLANLGAQVSNQILAQQAGLSGQQAEAITGLTGQQAATLAAYPSLLAAVVGDIGKYSTSRGTTGSTSSSYQANPLAPYELLASMLPYMIQYGTA